VYLKYPKYSNSGIRLSRDGTNHTVTSNLIYFGTGTDTTNACFNTSGLSTSVFTTFDNNLCYYAGIQGKWDATRTTLAIQQSSGLDLHSKTTNPNIITPTLPLFAAPLFSPSPAINSGNITKSTLKDILGFTRDSYPDIGAYEFTTPTPPPATPINGSCGSSNLQSFASAPTTNLCSAGTASTVAKSGSSWLWVCNGSNGGTNASCSAQVTVVPPTTSGTPTTSLIVE
jgi:hypothetical protein